jgi:hypothetical protein
VRIDAGVLSAEHYAESPRFSACSETPTLYCVWHSDATFGTLWRRGGKWEIISNGQIDKPGKKLLDKPRAELQGERSRIEIWFEEFGQKIL